MALVVNTNVASITSQMYVSKTNQSMADTMERLSSGKRINTAADDAAGMAIASRMEAQVKGLNQAIRNAADGQALIDTTEGAHQEVTNILQRMRELAVQAANDTNVAGDRQNLQAEVNQLVGEINRISSQTTWNGEAVLDGTFIQKSLQIGADASQTLVFDVDSVAATAIGAHTLRSVAHTDDASTTNSVLAASDITVSGREGSATIDVAAGASAKAIAAQVNAVAASTGVEASAVTKAKLFGLSATGNVSFDVNGVNTGTVNVSDTSDLRGVRDAINNISGRTGVSAVMGADNSEIILTDDDGDDIDFENFLGSANFKLDALNMDGTKSGTAVNTATATIGNEAASDTLTLSLVLDGTTVYSATGTSVNGSDMVDNLLAALTSTYGATTGTTDDSNGFTFTTSGATNLSVSRNDGKDFTLSLTAADAASSDLTLSVVNGGYTTSGLTYSETVTSAVSLDSTNDSTVSGQYELTSKNAFTVAQAGSALYDGSTSFGAASNSSTLSTVAAVNIETIAGSASAIKVIDGAIEKVNQARANLGAISNRLDNTMSNLSNISTNVESSRSRIEDADFAAESANLAKQQIMLQAGTAMLAQANAAQQNVLSLLG